MAWQIIIIDSGEALFFSSMFRFDLQKQAENVSNPVEQGSFASYNKVQSPTQIIASLGMTDLPFVLNAAIKRIERLQTTTDLVRVVTPTNVYEPFSVATFGYSLNEGQGILTLDLTLDEIREVKSRITDGKFPEKSTKNPTSASTSSTGKTQASSQADSPPRNSMLHDFFN